MNPRTWMLAAAAGLAGLAAGWWLGARGDAAPAAADTFVVSDGSQDSPRGVSPAVVSESRISLEDVRRVVREELAASAGAAHGRGQGSAAAVTEPEPPSAEQAAAKLRASSLVDAAIARRQWTDADVDALRAEFHQLTPEQQAEVMRDYAVAVNQGRLVPQTDRLPF